MSTKRTRTNAATATTPAPTSKVEQTRALREAAATAAPALPALSLVPPAPPSAPAAPVETPPAPVAETPAAPAPMTPEEKTAAWHKNSKDRNAKLRQMGPAAVLAVRCKRSAQRLNASLRAMKTWNGVVVPSTLVAVGSDVDVVAAARAALSRAHAEVLVAAAHLEKLPAGWKPVTARSTATEGAESAGSSRMVPGARVALRAKHAGHYEGILSAAELVGLTVTQLSKGVVVCKSDAVARLIFPRAHVQLAVETAAT